MSKYIFNTIIFLFLVNLSLSAQNKSKENYIQGYVITSENTTLEGLLETSNWEVSPQKVIFKTTIGEEKVYEITDLIEFGITDSIKYVKAIVNMERSSDQYNRLSINRNPEYTLETVFLKVLLEGEATLFEYTEPYLNRFFYSKGDEQFEPLVYKKYTTLEGQNRENKAYQQQLSNQIACQANDKIDFERIKYNVKDLVEYFKNYHTCKNLDYKLYYNKEKTTIFNLYLQTGINYTYLSDNNQLNTGNWRVGVEGEFVLTKRKNGSVFFGVSTYPTKIGLPYDKEEIITLYAIDIYAGFRYYYLLNKSHKIFLDASYSSVGSFTKKNITYINVDNVDVKLQSQGFINLGIGYKYKEKLLFAVRHNLNSQNYGSYSPYLNLTKSFGNNNRMSFIVAYQLF